MRFIHLKWVGDSWSPHQYTEAIRPLTEDEPNESIKVHFQRQCDEVSIITELPAWYFEAVLTGEGKVNPSDPWIRRFVGQK